MFRVELESTNKTIAILQAERIRGGHGKLQVNEKESLIRAHRRETSMGDYGWSMDFGTSQGSVAVEYGVLTDK